MHSVSNGEYKIGVSVKLSTSINFDLLDTLNLGLDYTSTDTLEKGFDNSLVFHSSNDYHKLVLRPKTFYVENAHAVVELEAVNDRNLQNKEEVLEDNLSQDFLEYNRKFYALYKNDLDLIDSNFELIYDGYSSSNLMDDLIVWTKEFNRAYWMFMSKTQIQQMIWIKTYIRLRMK